MTYLVSDRTGTAGNVVVYLTILASAASVLAGLFLRLILCCVVGAADDDDEDADRSDDGNDDGNDDYSRGHQINTAVLGGTLGSRTDATHEIELGSVNPAFDGGVDGL